MCGIAGIVYKKKLPYELVLESIKKMTDAAKHRGPDGEGHFIDNNVALGHRRLAILDLSIAGKQPMSWLDKYFITYNGEIYNYIEIREELKLLGYNFKSDSDTEVILAAYDEWGDNCVNKFNGMWAFAIYDKVKNIVFCSRDRFGVKPFYYKLTEDCFLFSSEIKQILSTNDRKFVINDTVAINYLVSNMMDYDDQTFFKGIRKLLGGHNLIYNLSNNTFEINKYYEIRISKEITNLNEEDSINLYKKIFEQSVKYRLRSDVKVGTCLSGGLDSSSIAAIANKLNKQSTEQPFAAITAQSIQKEFDEYQYAKIVSDSLNLDWYITKPETSTFIEYLDKVIYTQEYPFIGPTVFMQYFVMKIAKESGVTVLLDGQAADESLLGYIRYIPTILYQNGLLNSLKIIKKIKENYHLSYLEIVKNILYFTNPSLRRLKQLNSFNTLKSEYENLVNVNILKEYGKAYKNVTDLQKLEITKTQVPSLLRFEDKNSMAFSIETRLPFMDWELVEASLSINSAFKIRDGWSKWILRKSVDKELPESIVWRKNKIGFAAPIDEWMKDLMPEIEKSIDSSKILKKYFSKTPKNLNIYQMWRLYNLSKWEQLYQIQAQ
ncbi:asparagine synthase (glutamine-hydrolyzing) [Arcicella sp. LKC2W]|uniref:asparagine synthase (glutamine-hydrolyzing) n=1 Tax=Arcicella sp. LKC2W TaxID=2984198 RepID=UPI002B1F53F1|nr:asparagine synthase (glutamine-hydrolyzing) [Arcicella sp. LKC2W]MEA5461282.1 asparagine synthase (glutamine-hydrolyzing) [Arcicella sp. LKC2W]